MNGDNTQRKCHLQNYSLSNHSVVREITFFLYTENAVISSVPLSSCRWIFVNTREWQR